MGFFVVQKVQEMPEKKYLSVDEVARQFGIDRTTVYRLAQKNILPGFKVGGQWRFSQRMLETWVSQRIHQEGFKVSKRSA